MSAVADGNVRRCICFFIGTVAHRDDATGISFAPKTGKHAPRLGGQRRDEHGRDSQPIAAVTRRGWIVDC